jgi:hypothetical protein
MADDELYIPDVENLSSGDAVLKRDGLNIQERKKEQPRNPDEKKSGEHFAQLIRAAELANAHLKLKNLPYRVRVYQKEGEVFIDLVVMSAAGEVEKTVEKNITQDKFFIWLEHLASGEGMFWDNIG